MQTEGRRNLTAHAEPAGHGTESRRALQSESTVFGRSGRPFPVLSVMAALPGPHYSEAAAVTTDLIVICAVAGAVLTAAGAAVAVWRARATADQRVAEAVQRLASGMQETMRDLAGAVESAQAPGSERFAGELAASLDVDEVALRTLEAVAAIPGVDAAALQAGDVKASVAMAPDEADRTLLLVPDNERLGALEIAYRYRIDDVEGDAPV